MSYKIHQINNLKNYISGYYIDKSFCQKIVEISETKKILFHTDNSKIRNYQVVSLCQLGIEFDRDYQLIITDLLKLYQEEYPFIKKIEKLRITPYPKNPLGKYEGCALINVQKYKPGKYYNRLHCENSGQIVEHDIRALVFMTYLNTIDVAGGTDFPAQNFQSKAEQGLTLIWPAYFTHPHIGIVSENDTKYIMTGWIEFDRN